jgi:hypothetical protein
MEAKRSQNRVIFPYIILAIVLVCTALILSELWANVGGLVDLSIGPSPTPTLWWRTPQVTTPTSPPAATPPDISLAAPLETPAPAAESALETKDG